MADTAMADAPPTPVPPPADAPPAAAPAAKISAEQLPKINAEDLIVPPPELKSIIEVTVGYVVRNGLSFEGELRKRQQSSRKFDFLIPGNPYYKWYKWKLTCAIDPEAAKEAEAIAEKAQAEEDAILQTKKKEKELAQQAVKVVELTLKQKIEQDMKLHKKVKEEFKQLMPEPKYYVPLPSMMTTQEVDHIKRTAQFVARNGRTFLDALSNQAQQQGSLHQRYLFLNPIDPRFPYFQKLVGAYNECIVVPNETIAQLRLDMDIDRVYQEAIGAAEMTVIEERKRKALEETEQGITLERQLIDWQDFQVVETITFDEENEYYPAPGKDIAEINDILDMEQRKEINVVLAEDVDSDMEVDMDVDDQGGDSSDEEEIVEARSQVQEIKESAAPQKPTAAPDETIVTANLEGDIRLESEENRKLRLMLEKELFKPDTNEMAQANKFTKCPVTGVMVETRGLSEHIRISLLDPKWKQQKDKLLSRMQVSSLADDSAIVSNLSSFQRKHSQIQGFNSGESAAAGPAASDPEREKRLQEAREQNRLRKAAAAGIGGGAPPKRRRMDLVPEDQFMAAHRDAQNIRVQVPSGGQLKTLNFNITVSSTVADMKAQIQKAIGVHPTGQTLSTDIGMLEDGRTLAYYNLATGAELKLTL